MGGGTTVRIKIDSPSIRLYAGEVPWDSANFGVKVAQIERLEIEDVPGAQLDYLRFKAWLESESIGIVSCRLPHQRLTESIFLEDNGFRFVEMVLHPRIDHLSRREPEPSDLTVAPATEHDLAVIEEIAETAFSHERFHVDPRLDPRLGNARYRKWAGNSLHHPVQRLLKVLDEDRIIGMFLVEYGGDKSVYWHLTAIAPRYHGLGFGRRAWMAVLRAHQSDGIEVVSTTVSARNTPVLNLYAQLNFRFTPPHMTFHWIRSPQ